MKKIRIGICGYGNLGKGVELAIKSNPDMELVCIFTRRNNSSLVIAPCVETANTNDLPLWKDKIDVMILCGGSHKDLPIQGPEVSQLYNTVDSFDTHSDISMYYDSINKSAKKNKHVSIISVGWDPGLFSLNRLINNAVLPKGNSYTFWGKGVSQGHSDAIRQISGVKNAIQYTIPVESAINSIKNGENLELNTMQKHVRECFVVIENGVNKSEIENEIKNMPKYFSDYNTIVNFISEEELEINHSKMPHGGFVIKSGITENGNKQVMEFSLKLDSNPEFTASVLISYARAAYRMNKNGICGAKTVFDVPPYLLSIKSRKDLVKELL